ncbi:MAG TPA: VOC family protein [Holophaga sp.]|nr:VOC family protein [Holophaga sp.]
MERVVGIGGIFFKARDPQALRAWYARHLGLDVQSWGGAVFQGNPDHMTVWTASEETADCFKGTAGAFVVNYIVRDLPALLEALRAEGCAVEPRMDDGEFGKFGWVTDPEGNRVELWQPPA